MSKLSKEKIKAACNKVRRDVSAMSPEQRKQLERKARQVIAKGKTGTLLSDLEALAAEWEAEPKMFQQITRDQITMRESCARVLRGLITRHSK